MRLKIGNTYHQNLYMVKFFAYSVIFLFVFDTTYGSKPAYMGKPEIRPTIIEIVNQLSEINRFECELVGVGRNKTESAALYQQLTLNATTKELIQLVEHDNAVVQCYSIKALGEKESVDILPVLFSQLSNAKNMLTICGSSQQTQKVFDYVYAQLKYYEKKGKITLSENQKDQVYQNILYNNFTDYITYINQFKNHTSESTGKQKGIDNNLANYRPTALDDVLLRIQPKPAYYQRIREITEASISNNAIIALAKYQRKEDVALIKEYYPKFQNHTTWLNAILEFPDPWFLSDLEELQKQYLDKQFCRVNMICRYYAVLLQYKNQESIEIIKYGLEHMKYTKNQSCHLEALYAALELFPDPYYNNLKNNVPITQKQKERIKRIVEDYKETD